jgi:hypothetical protein
MNDIIYLATIIGFFIASIALVYGCERLRGARTDARNQK